MTDSQRSFTNTWILSAAVVGVVVILAIVLFVRNIADKEDVPSAPTSMGITSIDEPSQAASSTFPAEAESDSICGLPGVVTDGYLDAAPKTDQWGYVGTIAVPMTYTSGPGDSLGDGTPSCFQHSPEGAVTMAYHFVAASSNPIKSEVWREYFFSHGEYRQKHLERERNATPGDSSVRIRLAGFRLLEYDGNIALVDVAASTSNPNFPLASMLVPIIWENGDWRLDTDVQHFPDPTGIPDLIGYAKWEDGA